MRKRLSALLVLLMALCTAGCADQTAPDPAAPLVSGGIVLPGGLLPDGAYEIETPPARYYAETTLAVRPSADYGRIWPYVGGMAQLSWMSGNLFGLCDEDGKIICDPVFDDVRIIGQGDEQIYALVEFDQGENYEQIRRTTLCALDGSWAEQYDAAIYMEPSGYEYFYHQGYVWRERLVYDAISVKRDGRWGVVSYSGEMILPFDYAAPVCFSDGLAPILSEDGKTVHYIDPTGNPVLGPYEPPPEQPGEWIAYGEELNVSSVLSFYQGTARFYENGKFGIINRSGRVVLPAEYDYISSFRDGLAMAASHDRFSSGDGSSLYVEQERRGVVDLQGDWVVPLGGAYIYFYDGRILIDGESTQILLPDGTLVPDTSDGWAIISGSTVTFASGRTLTFPDDCWIESLPDSDNFTVYDREAGSFRVMDAWGSPLSEEISGSPGIQYDAPFVYAYVESINPALPQPFRIYDHNGSAVLPGVYSSIQEIDGRYLFRTDRTAGLLDEDGAPVIAVSILGYMED